MQSDGRKQSHHRRCAREERHLRRSIPSSRSRFHLTRWIRSTCSYPSFAPAGHAEKFPQGTYRSEPRILSHPCFAPPLCADVLGHPKLTKTGAGIQHSWRCTTPPSGSGRPNRGFGNAALNKLFLHAFERSHRHVSPPCCFIFVRQLQSIGDHPDHVSRTNEPRNCFPPSILPCLPLGVTSSLAEIRYTPDLSQDTSNVRSWGLLCRP